MAASRTADNADALRVDLVILGVEANETHRAVQVGDNLRDSVFRLTAVEHGEDRVTALYQVSVETRLNHIRAREKATADDQDDGRPIGVLRRREHVHGQGHAVFLAINHVTGTGEFRLTIRPGGVQYRSKKDADE